MKLLCYPTSGKAPRVIAAPLERDWMRDTVGAFAYRCLPLNIANAHGWFVLNDAPFVARWSGGQGLDAVSIEQAETEGTELLAGSHFGHGVLTFAVRCLFRTEPGYDLWVAGPTNVVKDGIQPLTGVVETDWSPATFTMNWKFTRKLVPVAFERDEPICMIFPVARGLLESVEPEIRALDDDAAVKEAYLAWSSSRRAFNAALKVDGSQASQEKWQKDYFVGRSTAGGEAPPDHRTKLRLKPFK